jgi:hypothetical protein
MKAEAKSLRFLGEGKKLTIPFFQRHYVWNKDNWEELLCTFENEDTVPFLGSLILKQAEHCSFAAEAIIIDGQQRLTTITILAKAIYDCLPEDNKKEGSGIRRDIESFLFYRNNSSDDFEASHVKIEHSRLDSADYNRVMKSGLLDKEDLIDCETLSEDASKILQCYKYFYDELSSKAPDELKKLHDSLFNAERQTVVVIELYSEDINEQRIFDTINRAGVKLSSADIIKNNLFKQCLDVCGTAQKTREDVCSLHDSLWEAVFYKNDEISQTWDAKRVFGNVQKSNLEFLLYCVAEIKWGKNADLFSNLEKVFSDNTSDYDYENIEDLIHEISEYGCLYKKYILDFHDKYTKDEELLTFGYKDSVNRLLLILDLFGVQMFYPYVLKRIKEANGDLKDASLCHDFSVLESFIIRRRLSGKGVTDYAIKCDQILHSSTDNNNIGVLAKEMSDSNSNVCDDAISYYVDKVNSEAAKPILFTFELYKRNQPMHDNPKLQYGFFTLEHIIPRKWTDNWGDVKIYDMITGKVLKGKDEDKIKYRNSVVNNLGNMILLNQPLNSSVSNKKIDIKINGIPQKNHIGYRTCSSMELTREIVTAFDNGKKVWDERSVADRKKNLLELFFKIWPNYSDEIIQEEDSNVVETTPVLEVGTVSQAALNDPIVMLQEMGESKANPFLTQIKNMPMQYSYKAVFMKSILDSADQKGISKLEDIVQYFINFYKKIREEQGYKEKEDSVFSQSECSSIAAKKTILTYPCDIFEKDGFIKFNKQAGLIQVNESIWKSLSQNDKTELHRICDEKIKHYFENNISNI